MLKKITLNDFKPTNFNFQENLVSYSLGKPKTRTNREFTE